MISFDMKWLLWSKYVAVWQFIVFSNKGSKMYKKNHKSINLADWQLSFISTRWSMINFSKWKIFTKIMILTLLPFANEVTGRYCFRSCLFVCSQRDLSGIYVTTRLSRNLSDPYPGPGSPRDLGQGNPSALVSLWTWDQGPRFPPGMGHPVAITGDLLKLVHFRTP